MAPQLMRTSGRRARCESSWIRCATLRNVAGPSGAPNGRLMHDGSLTTLLDVVNHYNLITFNPTVNPNLDNRLKGPTGTGQNLNLTTAQKNNLVAFLQTLTGSAVYTDERWSNPFDVSGNLSLIPLISPPTVIIDGKTKLMIMDTVTTGDYVVVRQNDGTLALRRNRLSVSATGDTLYNGTSWVIVPGISNANLKAAGNNKQ